MYFYYINLNFKDKINTRVNKCYVPLIWLKFRRTSERVSK